MKVTELNKDQLTELKERFYTEKQAKLGNGVSYGELANIDNLITNDEIMQEYDDTTFSNDDFFCSAGKDE